MKITNLAENAEDFTGNIWKIENKGKVALIDVGTGDSKEEISKLEKVDEVIVTHSHYDHVDNLKYVEEHFSPEIRSFDPGNLSVGAKRLRDNELIEIAGENFKVIHTPGHKNDSICLYNAEKGLLFTGDLIFPEGSFGRTDLEEGDRDQLIDSIEKIVVLDVESFYPGHEDSVKENAEKAIKKSLENAKKHESKY